MKLYISTPINSRREKNFREKYIAARHRCELLKEVILFDPRFDRFGEVITTFDVNGTDAMCSEEEAMGRCITAVMKCDAIYLDHGWQGSKGCNLEYRTAKIYGKTIFEHDRI